MIYFEETRHCCQRVYLWVPYECQNKRCVFSRRELTDVFY
jgi:hypothetical protein